MNAMHLARWPRSAGWLIGTLVLSTWTLALAAPPSGIPERPDQLQFPPLQYTPPEAAQYRVSLAGGILPNEPPAFRSWITDPDRLKPGVHMPRFGMLPDSDLRALAAYLEGLQ